jgi:hypothetical protein
MPQALLCRTDRRHQGAEQGEYRAIENTIGQGNFADQRRKQDNDADDSQKRADEHAAPCPRAENKPGKDDVHPEHR